MFSEKKYLFKLSNSRSFLKSLRSFLSLLFPLSTALLTEQEHNTYLVIKNVSRLVFPKKHCLLKKNVSISCTIFFLLKIFLQTNTYHVIKTNHLSITAALTTLNLLLSIIYDNKDTGCLPTNFFCCRSLNVCKYKAINIYISCTYDGKIY